MKGKQYSVNSKGHYTHVLVIGSDTPKKRYVDKVVSVYKKAGITPFMIGDGIREVTLEEIEKSLKGKIGKGTKIHIWAHGNNDDNGNHHIFLGKEGIPTKTLFLTLGSACKSESIDLVLSSCYSDAANKDVNTLLAGSKLITTSPVKESTLMAAARYDAELLCSPGNLATNFLRSMTIHPSYHKRMGISNGSGQAVDLEDKASTFRLPAYEAFLAEERKEEKAGGAIKGEKHLPKDKYRKERIEQGKKWLEEKKVKVEEKNIHVANTAKKEAELRAIMLQQLVCARQIAMLKGMLQHFDSHVLDRPSKDGLTALMQAAGLGRTEAVALLLGQGTKMDQNSLRLAITHGHLETANMLYDHASKQRIRMSFEDWEGILIRAAEKGYTDMVKNLLTTLPTVFFKRRDSALLLAKANRMAAANGHTGTVALLLERGASVDARNKNGNTALMWAAKNGHTGTVALLLERGASVDVRDKEDNTALMWAAEKGHVITVALLLEWGASVDARDKKGNTALMRVAEKGWVGNMQCLLDWGAKMDARNKNGNTALKLAEDAGKKDAAALLRNYQEVPGFSALMRAVKDGNIEKVEGLFKQETKLDVQGEEGGMALLRAAVYGHGRIVKCLVEGHQANLHYCMRGGTTALGYAAGHNHWPLVQYLVSRGANMAVEGKGTINAYKEQSEGHPNPALKKWLEETHKEHKGYTSLMEDKTHPALEKLIGAIKDKKLSPYFTDSKGRTVLHLYLEHTPSEQVEPEEVGILADFPLHHKDHQGKTVADIARERNLPREVQERLNPALIREGDFESKGEHKESDPSHVRWVKKAYPSGPMPPPSPRGISGLSPEEHHR